MYAHPVISERAIDASRPLKVIYIGAGISGIVAAIRFRQSVPNIDLVIYEKNPDIGGTWYENRYPGCACDIPSHTYQLSFESWTGWSKFYADSAEILEYWQLVAEKYDVKKHIKFRHKCIEAAWNDTTSKWSVKVQDGESGTLREDTADVLMTGTGTLNEWKWPPIKGLQNFAGQLVHSANWNDTVDLKNKQVAVIGSGSSAIQIVPAIIGQVKGIDHYVRGKTWIASQTSEDVLRARQGDGVAITNFEYTMGEKESWRKDSNTYLQYRRSLEASLNDHYAVTQSGSQHQIDAIWSYTDGMRKRLEGKPEVLQHLLPDFPPLCKRLTPGPGYLEALASPQVNVVSTHISHVDASGIITVDGVHRPVDVIVCATGFNTAPSAGFPIYGRNNLNLRVKYSRRPPSYLGLCTDGFPNFFQSLGPNSFQGAGSLLIMIEQIHDYVAQILEHMAHGNVRTIEPKKDQVENFTTFCDNYFKRTVYSAKCSSWYKSSDPEERESGRVNALWPGSCMHALEALKTPRWQDFEETAYDGNDFGWFGNGWSTVEQLDKPTAEQLTWYLNSKDLLLTLPDRSAEPTSLGAGEQLPVVSGQEDAVNFSSNVSDPLPGYVEAQSQHYVSIVKGGQTTHVVELCERELDLLDGITCN